MHYPPVRGDALVSAWESHGVGGIVGGKTNKKPSRDCFLLNEYKTKVNIACVFFCF